MTTLKGKLRKTGDNVRYAVLSLTLRIVAGMFSEYYVDQFETYRIPGRFGDVYLRFDRSIPEEQKKYTIKL